MSECSLKEKELPKLKDLKKEDKFIIFPVDYKKDKDLVCRVFIKGEEIDDSIVCTRIDNIDKNGFGKFSKLPFSPETSVIKIKQTREE